MTGEPVFNDLIHSPVRLRICGILRHADEVEFAVVRQTLGLTDAHLSKNIRVLTDAGVLETKKEAADNRSDARWRTWIRLTPAGKAALEAHLAALHLIANGSVPIAEP